MGHYRGGKITRNFRRDIIDLIAKKSKEYYDALIDNGYAIVGDSYIAIELKKQLNVNKIDYFVLTHLSIEYFILNLKGSQRLERIFENMYEKTERINVILAQLIPVIEYFKKEDGA